MLRRCGEWDADKTRSWRRCADLLTKTHPNEKVLVFTQFADTVRYLDEQLQRAGCRRSRASPATRRSHRAGWRFSPVSNNKRDQITSARRTAGAGRDRRLSEGQNLQDCAIVVNYDLPWAIIRLIQRAGRVDRIGQKADEILCYSFLPAEASSGSSGCARASASACARTPRSSAPTRRSSRTTRTISRSSTCTTRRRASSTAMTETEVDLASYAYQIWKNAIDRDPALQKTIRHCPPSSTPRAPIADRQPSPTACSSTCARPTATTPWPGSTRRPDVTESQLRDPAGPPSARLRRRRAPGSDNHHELVRKASRYIVAEEKTVGGQLGRPSGARFRTYERLKRYAEQRQGNAARPPGAAKAIDEIYRFPLRRRPPTR